MNVTSTTVARITVAAAISLPRVAAAQTAPGCPGREAVLKALAALASDPKSSPAVPNLERAELDVEDLGARYRVQVRGKAREYEDPSRDCAARAQVSAVFAALVLASASDEANAAPPSVEPPRPAAPVDHSTPRAPVDHSLPGAARARSNHVNFRAGGTFTWAPAAPQTHAAGLLVRIAHAWGSVAVELGAGVPLSPAHVQVGPVRAELLRYPFDLGGRYDLALGPVGVDLEAGALLSIVSFRNAQGGAESGARFEPGLRLGAGATWRGLRVAPAAGVFCSWTPVRYSLALEPTGVLAESPALGAGAWAGLSVRFD